MSTRRHPGYDLIIPVVDMIVTQLLVFGPTDQFRHNKIRPNTIDLNMRLWGITTEFVGFSCVEVYCFWLNFKISKLSYSITKFQFGGICCTSYIRRSGSADCFVMFHVVRMLLTNFFGTKLLGSTSSVKNLLRLSSYITLRNRERIISCTHRFKKFRITLYSILYNNQINARALIGQSAMVYCADKPMEKSRVLRIII